MHVLEDFCRLVVGLDVKDRFSEFDRGVELVCLTS